MEVVLHKFESCFLQMMDRAESEAPSMAMVPTPEAENVKEAEIAAAPARGQQSPPVINSMTHPDAWAWLNRSCKPGKNLVPDEVLSDWMAGGQKRNALLHSFVKKVYQPNASQQVNALRLEAWHRIRQATRDWTKTFQGFEWKTETEMSTDLKWSEFLGLRLFAMFCTY